jgi:O-antigen/teichoic acid export membrane protein
MSNGLTKVAEEAAKGSFHLFIGKASSTIISTITSILLARLLGPENYGLYSIALVLPSLFVGVVKLGLGPALTHFAARFRAERKLKAVSKFIETGLLFEIVVSLFVSMLCIHFSDSLALYVHNRGEIGYYLRLGAMLIPLQTLFDVLTAIFIGINRMQLNSLMMGVFSALKLVFSCLLILLGFDIIGALLGYILGLLTVVMIGFAYLRKMRLFTALSGFELNALHALLKYSGLIYFSDLILIVEQQYQPIIMSLFASNYEVGNFRVITLFTSLMLVLQFPFRSLFPSFSALHTEKAGIRQFYKKAVKYTSIIILPATVAISIMARDLIITFFGLEYMLASEYLSLYVLPYLLAGLGSIVTPHFLRGMGQTRIILLSHLLDLLLFIPLAPLFTNAYGMLGLIFALLVASSTTKIYKIIVIGKTLKILPDVKSQMRIYLASFLAAIPPLILLAGTDFSSVINLVLSAITYLITYFALLPLLKAIDEADIEFLYSIFNKNKVLWIIAKPILKMEAVIVARL